MARGFGASRRTVAALRSVARRHGLSARVDRSRVFARVRGTVRRFERLFGVRIRRQFDNDVIANGYFVPGRGPLRLPAGFRPLVREVVASFSRSTRLKPGSAAAAGRAAAAPAPANAGTWTGGCADARATGAYSFAQVRSAYGLDSVGPGAGASVAILNAGEGVPAPGHRPTPRACFGLPGCSPAPCSPTARHVPSAAARSSRRRTSPSCAGWRPGSGSVDLHAGLARDRPVVPRRRAGAGGAAPPDTLSMSYGECERDIRGAASARASRAGARSSWTPSSCGSGLPASAPLRRPATSARPATGSRSPASPGRPRLRSSPRSAAPGWSSTRQRARRTRSSGTTSRWLTSDDGGGAGGGGSRPSRGAPAYQRGLALPGRAGRCPTSPRTPRCFPGWPVVHRRELGRGRRHERLGPAGGGRVRRYQRARARRRAATARARQRPPLRVGVQPPDTLFDVVSGSNGYDPRVPALSAAPGYDLASGLGVPRFDRLAAALPAAATTPKSSRLEL